MHTQRRTCMLLSVSAQPRGYEQQCVYTCRPSWRAYYLTIWWILWKYCFDPVEDEAVLNVPYTCECMIRDTGPDLSPSCFIQLVSVTWNHWQHGMLDRRLVERMQIMQMELPAIVQRIVSASITIGMHARFGTCTRMQPNCKHILTQHLLVVLH
jgi:hypothetical protein